MAIKAAREALITDMHPLTPQAHGTFFSSMSDSNFKPIGKGKPIIKEGIKTKIINTAILSKADSPKIFSSNEGRKNE